MYFAYGGFGFHRTAIFILLEYFAPYRSSRQFSDLGISFAVFSFSLLSILSLVAYAIPVRKPW